MSFKENIESAKEKVAKWTYDYPGISQAIPKMLFGGEGDPWLPGRLTSYRQRDEILKVWTRKIKSEEYRGEAINAYFIQHGRYGLAADLMTNAINEVIGNKSE